MESSPTTRRIAITGAVFLTAGVAIVVVTTLIHSDDIRYGWFLIGGGVFALVIAWLRHTGRPRSRGPSDRGPDDAT